jgi:hypothetical protein
MRKEKEARVQQQIEMPPYGAFRAFSGGYVVCLISEPSRINPTGLLSDPGCFFARAIYRKA